MEKTLITHGQAWKALDNLAAANNMSASGLAVRCGLNATTFNKSKRVFSDGKPRWPSLCTIAKVLNTLHMSISDFGSFFPAR